MPPSRIYMLWLLFPLFPFILATVEPATMSFTSYIKPVAQVSLLLLFLILDCQPHSSTTGMCAIEDNIWSVSFNTTSEYYWRFCRVVHVLGSPCFNCHPLALLQFPFPGIFHLFFGLELWRVATQSDPGITLTFCTLINIFRSSAENISRSGQRHMYFYSLKGR